MRKSLFVCVCLLAFVATLTGQGGAEKPAGEQYIGTWTGTWDGAGAGGGIEVTFDKDTKGAMTGKVSVTGDPTYHAAFRTLSFESAKMTAKYDFPPDESTEVILAATFDGNKATGTWSARPKGSETEIVAGTWTVTKK